MKKRILFFTMIAAALTFSCQKAELEKNEVADKGNNEVVDFVPGPGKILAVTPTGAETKVAFGDAVDGKYPVIWTNTDVIKVYSENNAAGVAYTYTGEAAEGTSSAVFTGEPVEGETRYAVFPETRAYGFEDGKLKISFDALKKQEFHSSVQANGSNLKYMPMWAKEGKGDDTGKFVFDNLCGVVSFRFNDYQELRGMKITSVKITSASKYISGVATLDPADGSFTLAPENEDTPDADKEIVQEEISQLKEELQRLSDTTDFNGQKLLDGTFDLKGYSDQKAIRVSTFSEEVNPGNYTVSITKTGDTITGTLLSSDAPLGDSFVAGAEVIVLDNKITFKDKTGKELTLDVDMDKLAGGTTNASLEITDIGSMRFQVGANEGQVIAVKIPAVNLKNLGLYDVDVTKENGGEEGIMATEYADAFISSVRSALGAYQNRFEHVGTNLDTTDENLTTAYSRIMDVDMASEMTEYTTVQVLTQAGTSMLAQANERPQQILQLLQ